MFISKKRFEKLEKELYRARGGILRHEANISSLENSLANHKLYVAKELSSVYEKLVEVQKELSRKITDDCEKQQLLKMIEDTREAFDISRDKLYGEILALRDSMHEDDDEDGASIMDEYLNGGKADE